MGIFDKIFGKKKLNHNSETNKNNELNVGDTIISTDLNSGYKIIRSLNEEQKESIEKSTLLLRTGQLFMHYQDNNLESHDRNDPEWQNQMIFFWKAEEPFPKKSLPPHFEKFDKKYFLFQGDISALSLKVGEAIPWFGQPGLGEKHVCELHGESVTIPELHQQKLVEYVEKVDLTNTNLALLSDKEHYFFLIDDRITPFYNGSFYLEGKPVSISTAYSIGGIHLMKKTV